jgi:catechol 2,3-dioxygenase-like lactoylglutathione lyase family enzyme
MTLKRMDNIAIVVDDLAAAIAFFVELGMELEGETTVEGPSVMRTPDGTGRVELTRFQAPPAVRTQPEAVPVNALGIGRIMFAVDDIDEVLGRLQKHGAELVAEVAQYEDSYRLCYIRGPEGIVLALAQQLS